MDVKIGLRQNCLVQIIASWKCHRGLIVFPHVFIGGDWNSDLTLQIMNMTHSSATIFPGDEVASIIFSEVKQIKTFKMEGILNTPNLEFNDSWESSGEEIG